MRIDILYQFNEKYAPYAGISITSLFENNKHIEDIVVHILDDNISPVSKARLISTANDYKRRIEFIDTQDLVNTMINIGIPKYRGSYAANLKLFLPMVISGDIDKLLYIDSDTVVTGDVEPLFKIKMNGKPIAMVMDSLGKKHKQLIGLEKSDRYYNSGVMLLDIMQWKNQMCTEKIIEHVKNVRAHYMSPDQDLLNVVLKDDIYTIGPKYNLQPVHLVYGYKSYALFFGQKNYHGKKEVIDAIKNPVIVHFFRFLGQFPWDADSLHPDKEVFDKYMEISRWQDYKKTEPVQTGLVFKIERWLYKNMPSFVFLVLFKLNYEIFIKKCERESRKNRNSDTM